MACITNTGWEFVLQFFLFFFMSETEKGCSFQNLLLMQNQDSALLSSRRKWEADTSSIDGESWEAALTAVPLVSVWAAQKLSHLFILHCTYRRPKQLFTWGRRDSPICPKCKAHNWDFIHMIWKCPKLVRYWGDMTYNPFESTDLPLRGTRSWTIYPIYLHSCHPSLIFGKETFFFFLILKNKI